MGALPFSTLVLSLLGLVAASYLTYTHVAEVAPTFCPTHGIENCAAVTTSPESEVFGVLPVAELGLAFYIFLVAINSPWAWRSTRREVHWARLASLIAGIVFVLYLVYTEIITLGQICLYCTSVHIITFLLFGLIVYQATSRNSPLTARR